MLRQRALSAVIFVPPLLVFVVLGEPWFAGLVGLLVLVASLEALALVGLAGYPPMRNLGAAAALAVALDAAFLAPLRPFAGLLTAAAVVCLAVAAFRFVEPKAGFATWLATAFTAVYVGQLGFLVRLGQIAPGLPADAPLVRLGSERAWLLLVILLVWSYDTAAYLVGRTLGRRKFLVHISPSKSYWGLAGGVVAAAVVAAAGSWLLGQPPLTGLLLGPLVALAAQAGDLAESLLKRAAGAKDSSHLIPGHGGMLDRIDSFLFAAPVAAIYVAAVVH